MFLALSPVATEAQLQVSAPAGTDVMSFELEDFDFKLFDFGIIRKGDSLDRVLTLTNSSADSLAFGPNLPFYYLGQPYDLFWKSYRCEDCNEFYNDNSIPSFNSDTLHPGKSKNLLIGHNGNINQRIIDTVNYLAELIVTPVNDQTKDLKYPEPSSSLRLFLLTRVTSKPLGTYRRFVLDRNGPKLDTISFDTIISNGSPVDRIWTLKNVADSGIEIKDSRMAYISNDLCGNMLFSKSKLPNSLAPKREAVDVPITHTAIQGCVSVDTAIAEITYEYESQIYRDSVVTVSSSINYDVDLLSVEMNGIPVGDSSGVIVFPDLDIDINHEVSMRFVNLSSIPISLDSFFFSNVTPPISPQDLLYDEKEHIPPGDTFDLRFTLKPMIPGVFNHLTLSLATGLEPGRFANQTATDEIKRFTMRGKVVGPTLTFKEKLLDFGEIVISGNCDSSIDTIVIAFNEGSQYLRLKSILNSGEVFSIGSIDTMLPPQGTVIIPVTFEPTSEGEFEETLILNDSASGGSFRLNIRGSAVKSKDTQIITQEISARPGTRISLPLLFDRNNLDISDRFSTSLEYNGSLLDFAGYESDNSASELMSGISSIGPERDSIGFTYLDIDIQTEEGSEFLRNPLLLTLLFDTYLGDAASTPIRIVNPRFGNSNCDDVIDLRYENSWFSLDSVIALQSKVFDKTAYLNVAVSSFTESVDMIEIHLETPQTQTSSQVEIYVSDLYGKILSQRSYPLNHNRPLTVTKDDSGGTAIRFLTILHQGNIIGSYKFINN